MYINYSLFLLAFWLFGRCSVVMLVLRKVDAVGGRGLRPCAAPPRVAGCACRCASDTAHNALPAPFGRSARGRAPLMRCPPLRGGLVCRLPPCATRSVGGHAPRSERPPAMPESLKIGVARQVGDIAPAHPRGLFVGSRLVLRCCVKNACRSPRPT